MGQDFELLNQDKFSELNQFLNHYSEIQELVFDGFLNNGFVIKDKIDSNMFKGLPQYRQLTLKYKKAEIKITSQIHKQINSYEFFCYKPDVKTVFKDRAWDIEFGAVFYKFLSFSVPFGKHFFLENMLLKISENLKHSYDIELFTTAANILLSQMIAKYPECQDIIFPRYQISSKEDFHRILQIVPKKDSFYKGQLEQIKSFFKYHINHVLFVPSDNLGSISVITPGEIKINSNMTSHQELKALNALKKWQSGYEFPWKKVR